MFLLCLGKMSATEDFSVTATTSISTVNATTEFEYNYDYEEAAMCIRTSIRQFGVIFNPVLFSIVTTLSLVGNILVLIIVIKYENLKSLTNAFILNLAVSDLLFTIGLPFSAYYHIYGWTLGEPACKIVSFLFNVGFYSSGVLLILMTAHRYVAVMNPLSGLVSPSGAYSGLATLIIWALSIFVSTPALTKVLEENYCTYKDNYWSLWDTYQQNVLFILTSVVFLFCYSQIMCRLLRPSAQRRRNKTVKLIFALMVIFFVGWAPYNTVIFLKSTYSWTSNTATSQTAAESCENYKRLDYAHYFSRLFAFSHCCLNPVLYVFVGDKHKKHLRKVVTCWNDSSVRSRHCRLTITSLTSGEEFSM